MNENNKNDYAQEYTPLTEESIATFLKGKKDSINAITEILKAKDAKEAVEAQFRREQKYKKAVPEIDQQPQKQDVDEKISNLTDQVSRLAELMAKMVEMNNKDKGQDA